MSHDCEFCRRHQAVKEMLSRLPSEADRKLVEDLHDKLSHVEDDLSYDSIVLSAYRAKYGPMGFAEANAILCESEKARMGKP